MGTWLGHAAPGTYFLVFSIWWLVRTMQQYYRKQGHYVNTAMKTCCCKSKCCKLLPGEGLAVLITALSGIIAEILTGLINDSYIPMVNYQHLTMYTCFGIAGVIEILVINDTKFLPKKADYLAVILSLLVELVLFAFHLHDRNDMDKHVHMLLVYTIASCVLCTALEMYFINSILAAIGRIYFFMLQGTWFIQVGFLLYNPLPGAQPWNGEDPMSVMITTLIFAWHMIGCLVGTIVISLLVYKCGARHERGRLPNKSVRMSLLNSQDTRTDRQHLLAASLEEEAKAYNGYASLDEYEEDSLFTAPPSAANSKP